MSTPAEQTQTQPEQTQPQPQPQPPQPEASAAAPATTQEAAPVPTQEGSASESAPAAEAKVEPKKKLLGFDFGSQKAVVTVSEVNETVSIPHIIRNDISELQTPSLLAFNGKQRLVGENARGRSSIHPHSAVTNVAVYLGKTEEQLKKIYAPFKLEGGLIDLPYGDGRVALSPAQAASVIFKRLEKYVDVSLKGESVRDCCVVVKGNGTVRERSALKDAARIAGFNVLSVVPEHTAVACLYALKKFSDSSSEFTEAKNICFVDVGYSNTSISLAKYEKGKITVLCSSHLGVGGFDFDQKIYEHSAKILKEKHSFDVTTSARYTVRLYAAAEKAKITLSTIKETELLYATPDQDIKIPISRALLESLVAEEIKQIEALVKQFLEKEEVKANPFTVAEIIGGGSRIPVVSQVIEGGLGLTLGHGLDSTLSVGLGAASYASLVAYGAQQFQIEDKTFQQTEQELEGAMDEAELQRCIKLEEEMSNNDRILEERAHERNILEAFLFQTKSHLTEPKFEDCFDATIKEQIQGILTSGTFWLEDNEGEEVSGEDYKAKYAETVESIKKLAPKLFEKLEEIEKEKAKAAAEAASVPIVTKKSKPRTNKQKLEAAANKKEHGNKLFVDLDYANAVRRYTQALELVQSLYDETPDQKEEANKLKVVCYLNIAGCLQKVQGYQKAVENCKSALDIEPDNAKALFRRGQAYFELKEFELARDDLTKADKLTPNNKQILHLLARSKNEITKRQEREKKMYSKMFN